MSPMQHATRGFHDLHAVPASPNFPTNILNSRRLAHLVHVRSTAEAEPEGPGPHKDLRRTQFRVEVMPERSPFEHIDVIHVLARLVECLLQRELSAFVLPLAEPNQTPPVANHHEDVLGGDFAFAGLVHDASTDEMEAH